MTGAEKCRAEAHHKWDDPYAPRATCARCGLTRRALGVASSGVRWRYHLPAGRLVRVDSR